MLSLFKRPYEPSVWKRQTVGNDYLISDGLNKHSVPFDLIVEQVQIFKRLVMEYHLYFFAI